ncbi:hypothetical protein [Aquabacterium sp.]|uniref:hypothetical protein n=1 Tax=Aquabacterium sp. TaxID=1872578 RepID=UPI002C34ABE4|nr:hypothetical protein [Aquabacterium sp.]HSW06499.1 hypothetical protein [Aquabacterium sp.]
MNRLVTALCAFAAAAFCSAALALPAADALRAGFAAARERSGGGISDRPVYLQSTETPNSLSADVHALVDQPFDSVRQELGSAASWCEVLILHLNVKYCRASTTGGQEVLDVGIGRKFDQPLADVHWARFAFRSTRSEADHIGFELQAPTGPMSTKDFRITMEATPLTARQTVVRMTYAYGFGTVARWAMQAYLSTLGKDKVGFSITGRGADGQPLRIGGVRGMVERNTMRYYLAIESRLGAHGLPPPQQLRKSLQDCFDATERYARQLHEMDRADYLDMKLREVQRQATTAPPVPRG